MRELDRRRRLDLGGVTVTVDHTPGHTRGSVVFSLRGRTATEGNGESARARLHRRHAVRRSIGRTDLPGGGPRAAGSILATVGARRRHRGAARPRRPTIGRERAQPVPRRLRPCDRDSRRPRASPTTSRRTRAVRRGPRHPAARPPTAPATRRSSCRSSRTPRCSRAASASPPTWSPRRCTPSPTAAAGRSRCARRAPPG